MRCLISPSPALFSASTTLVRPPPCKLPTTMLRVSRPAPSFPRLKLRPGETVALRPRCLAVRAQVNHGREVQLPNHFVEEIGTILGRSTEIYCTYEGFLHLEALNMSGSVCISAAKAVIMASQLVDSGSLPDGVSSKICADTVHGTLRAYVDVFLYVSEDCYNRTFDRDTVIRFLDALRGLACISHILLEDALEALSHTHPRESLLEYAFNSDVKNIHRDFNCQMDDLEDGIWNPYTRTNKPVELVDPTIRKGVEVTESCFLGLMAARRQRTLEKACSSKQC